MRGNLRDGSFRLRLMQMTCRHDWHRCDHLFDGRTVWMCCKCAKEISEPTGPAQSVEGQCQVCGRPVRVKDDCCPRHPQAAVLRRVRRGRR